MERGDVRVGMGRYGKIDFERDVVRFLAMIPARVFRETPLAVVDLDELIIRMRALTLFLISNNAIPSACRVAEELEECRFRCSEFHHDTGSGSAVGAVRYG